MNNAMALQPQPSLRQLNQLIKLVPKYPVSASRLVALARRNKQPQEVQDFFRTFPQDIVFEDRDDLKERAEQVEMMRQEEKDMPPEQMIAPEEY